MAGHIAQRFEENHKKEEYSKHKLISLHKAKYADNGNDKGHQEANAENRQRFARLGRKIGINKNYHNN